MTELKKCPHCGGEAEIYIQNKKWTIECKNCFCKISHYTMDSDEMTNAWNKRAKDENSLTLGEIRAVLENYKNNAYCNSTSCKIFGNFVSCLECLMHELQKKARG